MTRDYTPTTEDVRNEYVRSDDPTRLDGLVGAEFDRWIADVRRQERIDFADSLTRLGVHTLSIHDIRKYAKEES